MNTVLKNAVLQTLAHLIDQNTTQLVQANTLDANAYQGDDQALYDRLLVNDKKIEGMVQSVLQVMAQDDPVGRELYRFTHDNQMEVVNRSAPFGTIFIIYESRPDVTIEAAILAFKAGNKIILKGGKEAKNSNLLLVNLWHQALETHGLSKNWVTYLDMPRQEVQAFLKAPDRPIDLIVPRGGERLIAFVKAHARCPVLVSGRGNNYIYIDAEADLEMATQIILSAKTSKISACNALDKVLIHQNIPHINDFIEQLIGKLSNAGVEIYASPALAVANATVNAVQDENIWYEEFLAMKIAFKTIANAPEAIAWINKYSGGHSASIITANANTAQQFMEEVDAAAVYHNASTRFTDGGQFGLGAELAISTDKLHHRGPLALNHLVSNKWYIKGTG